MFTLLHHQYPEIAHNLTCSVNLAFMRKLGLKNKCRVQAGFGLQNKARLQIWELINTVMFMIRLALWHCFSLAHLPHKFIPQETT